MKQYEMYLNEIFIRNLGFTFDDEDALKKLKAIKSEFFKKERKIKGKLISIDEEFEDVIKKRPFLLKEFPSLKSYYYIENGLVFKRSNGKKLS